jgi:ribosome-associated protein
VQGMTQQPQPDQPGDAHGDRPALGVELARALHDAKCSDVMVIDVRGLSQVTDHIVVATGSSDRQMRSAGDDAEEAAGALGHKLFGRSVDAAASWIVLDFVDVVVHIFEPNTRAYYDLETLWGDGPRVEWQRPGGQRAPGA